MDTRRGARGLSHRGRSSRSPEALLDDSDSMANSIICTGSPGNMPSTLASTDEQHPLELVQEATENCERLQQHFEKMAEKCQRLRSRQQHIECLLEEIRSACANVEKSKEMLQQCIGIPEPGALSLCEKNTKQEKEGSAQEKKAELKDRMEASERERLHAEMLEQWEKENTEREQEHQEVLFEMRQKVATLPIQQEEEQTRFENARREEGELTSQLAASQESQEAIIQREQQDVSWAQEEPRQRLLDVEDIQNMLEEAENKNKKLQMYLQILEMEWSQWEEVSQQNSQLQAAVNVLEKEKARLILSLEEKNLCLRTLEEKNMALNNQVSHFRSALQQAEQIRSEHRRGLQELNTETWALLEAVMEKAALQETQEKQLETEVSELRVRLQSSEERAEAMATQCKAVELELMKTQAQRDQLNAQNQELQKLLEESEQAIWRGEQQKTSLEIALKEEAETLHQEVASLRRKLGSLEKERKDFLHERELYQQQMRELEMKNEMRAAEMQSQQGRMLPKEQLEIEKETKQEVLDLEASCLKEGRGSALSAALSKYKIARGALKKQFAFLKGKTCLQQTVGAQEEQLLLMSETSLESEKPVASKEKEKTEWPEWSTEPRRTGEQAAGAEGEQLSEHSRKAVECVRCTAAEDKAEDKAEKREATTEPTRTSEVAPEGRSVERTCSSVYIPDTVRLDVSQSAQQSMPTSAEQAAGAEGEQLSEHSRKAVECVRCKAAEDKAEKCEATTEPTRTSEVAPKGRQFRTFRRVFPPDYYTLPVRESVQENTSSSEGEKSSSSSGEQQPSF